jgi:hypothetical protein
VLILTPKDKKRLNKWMETSNDTRSEDGYLMAAPITIRRLGDDGNLAREMVMILYANHPKNVFRKWHRDIVRCCVDTVSTAISLAAPLTTPGRGDDQLLAAQPSRTQDIVATADVRAMTESENA